VRGFGAEHLSIWCKKKKKKERRIGKKQESEKERANRERE